MHTLSSKAANILPTVSYFIIPLVRSRFPAFTRFPVVNRLVVEVVVFQKGSVFLGSSDDIDYMYQCLTEELEHEGHHLKYRGVPIKKWSG